MARIIWKTNEQLEIEKQQQPESPEQKILRLESELAIASQSAAENAQRAAENNQNFNEFSEFVLQALGLA